MKKILCGALLLLLLVTLPLGCGKKEASLKTLELHEVTRSVFYAPQYVALNLGYFEAEGLEVNITTSGGSDIGRTAEKLQPYMPGAKILKARVLKGAKELDELLS